MMKTVLSLLAADRVLTVSNGVKCAGFLLAYCLKSDESFPTEIITPFVKTMNHSFNDVKVLVAQLSSHLAYCDSSLLPASLLKSLVPMLVNGTMKKNYGKVLQ